VSAPALAVSARGNVNGTKALEAASFVAFTLFFLLVQADGNQQAGMNRIYCKDLPPERAVDEHRQAGVFDSPRRALPD